MLYTRARAFPLLFEASTAAKAAPHTIPYGLASMQRVRSVVGNKIGHRSRSLRDSGVYAFDQAAQRCDAMPQTPSDHASLLLRFVPDCGLPLVSGSRVPVPDRGRSHG